MVKIFPSRSSLTLSGTITRSNKLFKQGSGTLNLSGTQNYTGTTTVEAGALSVNGSLAGSSSVTVQAGGILKGSGTVGGATTLQSGGTLAPGNSPGVETFSSGLNFESGSIFSWDLNTTLSGRGTAYDGANVAGGLTGSDAIFKIVLAGGQNFPDSFWDTNRAWTDIFIDGASAPLSYQSIFSSFQYADETGTTISPTGNGTFAIAGSSLTWTVVPEPSSALSGLLLIAALIRRRRA